jgi:hypothetical protein
VFSTMTQKSSTHLLAIVLHALLKSYATRSFAR